jgi:hypothetical protein
MSRQTFGSGALLLAALATLLAGCGLKAGTSAGPDAPRTVGSQAGGNPKSGEEIVRAIGVTKQTLPALYRTKNEMHQGNTVAGQVTLDMCAGTFASESLRTARHQVLYGAKDKKSSVSTETVSYRAGGAARAMRELHQALSTCPDGWVRSGDKGSSPVKEQYATLFPHRNWEPGALAVRFTERNRAGKSVAGVLIYQRHGDLLSALYVIGLGDTLRSVLIPVASHCAAMLARELNAAPSSATLT